MNRIKHATRNQYDTMNIYKYILKVQRLNVKGEKGITKTKNFASERWYLTVK